MQTEGSWGGECSDYTWWELHSATECPSQHPECDDCPGVHTQVVKEYSSAVSQRCLPLAHTLSKLHLSCPHPLLIRGQVHPVRTWVLPRLPQEEPLPQAMPHGQSKAPSWPEVWAQVERTDQIDFRNYDVIRVRVRVRLAKTIWSVLSTWSEVCCRQQADQTEQMEAVRCSSLRQWKSQHDACNSGGRNMMRLKVVVLPCAVHSAHEDTLTSPPCVCLDQFLTTYIEIIIQRK